MPILDIQLTDTFQTWFNKTNAAIDQLNTMSTAGQVLSVTNPAAGQLLVFNGTAFSNVNLSGALTLSSNGTATLVSSKLIPRGRLSFAAAVRQVY